MGVSSVVGERERVLSLVVEIVLLSSRVFDVDCDGDLERVGEFLEADNDASPVVVLDSDTSDVNDRESVAVFVTVSDAVTSSENERLWVCVVVIVISSVMVGVSDNETVVLSLMVYVRVKVIVFVMEFMYEKVHVRDGSGDGESLG